MYGDLYINIILMHCTFYFLVLVFFLINILFWNFSSTTSFFTFIISFFNPSLFLSTTLCLAFYFSFPIFHSLFLCTKIPLTITSLYIQFLNFSFFSSQLSVVSQRITCQSLSSLTPFFSLSPASERSTNVLSPLVRGGRMSREG